MKHVCEIMYDIAANNIVYGDTTGICRITGKQSKGIAFEKWVRRTFTDFAYLKPGTIISNEALFCFDEASEIVQRKTGRDKLQRFRTYSHIICNGEWFCCTKADKKRIYELICSGAEIVSLTDTGQKHIFFKNRVGMWQLDEHYIPIDIPLLKFLHEEMTHLLDIGFSQTEVISGKYSAIKLFKYRDSDFLQHENKIKAFRGNAIFDFTGWMLFTNN